MKKILLALLCVFSFNFLPSSASALPQDENSLAAARSELTELIRQLLGDIDPSAKVVVKLTAEKMNLKLPGTALSFKSSDLDQGDLYASAEITILSLDGKLPPSVQALIQSTASEFAKNVTIKTQILPAEYRAASRKANAQANAQIQAQALAQAPAPQKPAVAPPEAPKSWEEPFAESLKQFNKLSSALTVIMKPKLWKDTQLALKNLTRMVGIALLVLSIVAIAGLYLHSASMKNFERSMRALAEKTPERDDVKERRHEQPTESRSSSPQPQSQPSDMGATMISQMPEGSLLALFTDCYWTGEDQYAGYLWKRIPYNLRLQLIDHMPALFEYGAFITSLEEMNLGYEQDPSYLVPLPIHDVNMEQLTLQLRQNPSLYFRMSVLRKMALPLSPSERLAYHRLTISSADQEASSLVFEQSPARVLRKKLLMSVTSFADEMEIMMMSTIDLDVVEAVPSLGWLLHLPRESAERILLPYSARDLATAWIGPPEVLVKLESVVGVKKLGLLKSYMEKSAPSRESQTFADLHRDVIEAWKRGATPFVEGDKNAA